MLCYELWQVGSFPDIADVLVSFLWDLPFFLIFFFFILIFFFLFFRVFSSYFLAGFSWFFFVTFVFWRVFPAENNLQHILSFGGKKKKSNQGKVQKSKPKECGLACFFMQSEKIILLRFFFFFSSSFIFIIVHPLWPLLCLFFLSFSPT